MEDNDIRIQLYDFNTTKVLWEQINIISDTLCLIRQKFQFRKRVIIKYYETKKAVEGELNIAIPEWVKAFSINNYIGVINMNEWKENDNIKKILIHEFTHCAMRAICKKEEIPLWVDEGIAMYMAHQIEQTYLETEKLLEITSSETILDNIYVYASDLMNRLVSKIGIETLIKLLKNERSFFWDLQVLKKAML